MFCYFGLPSAMRLGLCITAVVIVVCFRRLARNAPFPTTGERGQRNAGNGCPAIARRIGRWLHGTIRRLAARPVLSIVVVFGVSLTVNLAFGLIRYPYPSVHDEWAYLLAGDTYASGRLTNPSHPFWRHFETYHVLSQPTYMAKYPPAGGLVLALGQTMTGHPIAGVWLIQALALAALCWMLRAWISPRWALTGSLLLSINAPMVLAWGQTYWGGGAALLGGALVFGAVRRIARLDRLPVGVGRNGIALAMGAVILANSRPFEGLLVCMVAGGILIDWLIRNPVTRWRTIVQMAIPVATIGGAGAAFFLANNRAVTGDLLTMPYNVHSRQYSATSMWIWKPVPEVPQYNLRRMNSLYVNFSRERQLDAQTPSGFVKLAVKKLNLLWGFFPLLGGVCLLPAVFLVRRRDGWFRVAAVTVVMMLVISLQLVHSHLWPHYLAPVVGLFYVIVFQGLRWWRVAARQVPAGRIVLPAVVVYSILHLVATGVWLVTFSQMPERQIVEKQLAAISGKHLVFVNYPVRHNLHDEWVYNRANIDASDVVWANRLTDDEDRRLVEWYAGSRNVWVWTVGEQGPQALQPWRCPFTSDNYSSD